jgi:hypothetical protein
MIVKFFIFLFVTCSLLEKKNSIKMFDVVPSDSIALKMCTTRRQERGHQENYFPLLKAIHIWET